MALKHFLDILIPPLCEGCDALLDVSERRLCKACLVDLEPIATGKKDQVSAIWYYGGAAKKLITRYKEAKKELDAPLFASFILLQIDKLGWPIPEMVVTIPQDPFKKLWVGFDPIGEIGRQVAKSYNIPIFTGFKRQGGRSSQASLHKEARTTLTADTFFLTEEGLEGKRLLLLDDVMTTGSTLKAAATTLWQASPLSIYSLALAKVELEE